MCPVTSHSLLSPLSFQIEDLSQQAHKAAAEKFKVPVTSSPLAPPVPPSLTIKEESEEEEEEVPPVTPSRLRCITALGKWLILL